MKKHRLFKVVVALVLCFAMLVPMMSAYGAAVASSPTSGSSSALKRTTTTTRYSCRAHSNCMYIKFVSEGNVSTGAVYDKYFSASSAHWPNAFTYGKVWSYKIGTTGYAKGTYTIYSSLITQWVSLTFTSKTKTITHTY